MEIALVIRDLLSKWKLLLLGVLIAAAAATFSVYRLDGFGLKSRSLVYSAASTQAFIDTPSSVLGNVDENTVPLQTLATVYANFMASPTVLAMIGHQVGLGGNQIYAAGPVDPNVPRTVQEPTALQRNLQIAGESTPYRLGFTADPNLPEIGIYAQAPSTTLAVALANASVVALRQYVTNIQSTDKIPPASRAVIRQLGTATGSVVDPQITKTLAALVGVAVFVLWCALMLAGSRFVAVWRRSGVIARSQRRWDPAANGARPPGANGAGPPAAPAAPAVASLESAAANGAGPPAAPAAPAVASLQSAAANGAGPPAHAPAAPAVASLKSAAANGAWPPAANGAGPPAAAVHAPAAPAVASLHSPRAATKERKHKWSPQPVPGDRPAHPPET